jgi:hypothetical protein
LCTWSRVAVFIVEFILERSDLSRIGTERTSPPNDVLRGRDVARVIVGVAVVEVRERHRAVEDLAVLFGLCAAIGASRSLIDIEVGQDDCSWRLTNAAKATAINRSSAPMSKTRTSTANDRVPLRNSSPSALIGPIRPGAK